MLMQEVSKELSYYVAVTFFIGIYLFGWYLMSLKCPICGTPIIKNELFVFGINTHMWMPFPKKNCSECGQKID